MRTAIAIACSALALGCGGGQPAAPADRGLHAKLEAGDEQFRQAVRQYATSTSGLLSAWGTTRLDGGPATSRFATIEPSDPTQPGAYVLGTLDGALWLVRYFHDGRTKPFAAHDLAVGHTQPDFHFYSGIGVRHAQGRGDGTEIVTFGFANGAVVVFDRAYAIEHPGEPATVPERVELAIDGACKTTCPPVAGFAFTAVKLTVSGPVTTGEALTTAARDPASLPVAP